MSEEELRKFNNDLQKILNSVEAKITKAQNIEVSANATINSQATPQPSAAPTSPPPPPIQRRKPGDARAFSNSRDKGLFSVASRGDIDDVTGIVETGTNPLLASIRATDYPASTNIRENSAALTEITSDLTTLSVDEEQIRKTLKQIDDELTRASDADKVTLQATKYNLTRKLKEIASEKKKLSKASSLISASQKDAVLKNAKQMADDMDMLGNAPGAGGITALKEYSSTIADTKDYQQSLDINNPDHAIAQSQISFLEKRQRMAYDKSAGWQGAVRDMRIVNDPSNTMGTRDAQTRLGGRLSEIITAMNGTTDTAILKILSSKKAILEREISKIGKSDNALMAKISGIYTNKLTVPGLDTATFGTAEYHNLESQKYSMILREGIYESQGQKSALTGMDYTPLANGESRFSPEQTAQMASQRSMLARNTLQNMRASSAEFNRLQKEEFTQSFDAGNLPGMKLALNEMARRKHEVQNLMQEAYKDPSEAGKGLYNLYKRDLTELRMTEIEMKHMFAQELAMKASGGKMSGDFGKQNTIGNWMGNFGIANTAVMKEFEERSGKIRQHWNGIATAGFYTAGAVAALVYQGTMVAAQFERTRVVFKALVGDAGEANRIISNLMVFSLKTPYKFTELTEMASQLIAAGFKTREIMPILKNVTDAVTAVGGDKALLDRVIYDFGKMKSTNRIDAREMRTLAYARIPGWQMLAENYQDARGNRPYVDDDGKTNIAKLMKDVSARKIGAEGMVAIQKGMDVRYGGVAEEAMNTTQGRMENFQERLVFAANKIFQAFLPITNKILDAATNMLTFLSTPGMRDLIVNLAQVLMLMGGIGGMAIKISTGVMQFMAFNRVLMVTNQLTAEFTAMNNAAAIGIQYVAGSAAAAAGTLTGLAAAMSILQVASLWLVGIILVLSIVAIAQERYKSQQATRTSMLESEVNAANAVASAHRANADAIYRSIREYDNLYKLVGRNKEQNDLYASSHENLARKIMQTSDKYKDFAALMRLSKEDITTVATSVANEERRAEAKATREGEIAGANKVMVDSSGFGDSAAGQSATSDAGAALSASERDYEGVGGSWKELQEEISGDIEYPIQELCTTAATALFYRRMTAFKKHGFSTKEARNLAKKYEQDISSVDNEKGLTIGERDLRKSDINEQALRQMQDRLDKRIKEEEKARANGKGDKNFDIAAARQEFNKIYTSIATNRSGRRGYADILENAGKASSITTVPIEEEYGDVGVYDKKMDVARMVTLENARVDAVKKLKAAEERYLRARQGEKIVSIESKKVTKDMVDQVTGVFTSNGKDYKEGQMTEAIYAPSFAPHRAGEPVSEEEKTFIDNVANMKSAVEGIDTELKDVRERSTRTSVASRVRNLKLTPGNMLSQQLEGNRKAASWRQQIAEAKEQIRYDAVTGEEIANPGLKVQIGLLEEELAALEAVNKAIDEKRKFYIETGPPLKVVDMLIKEISSNALHGSSTFDVFAKSAEAVSKVLSDTARMGTLSAQEIEEMLIKMERFQALSEALSATRGLKTTVEDTSVHKTGFGFTSADEAMKVIDESEQVATKIFKTSDRGGNAAKKYRDTITYFEQLRMAITKAGKVADTTIDAVRAFNESFKELEIKTSLGWTNSAEAVAKVAADAWEKLVFAIKRAGGSVKQEYIDALNQAKRAIDELAYQHDKLKDIASMSGSELSAEQAIDQAEISGLSIAPGDHVARKKSDMDIAEKRRVFDHVKMMNQEEAAHKLRLLKLGNDEFAKEKENNRYEIWKTQNDMIEASTKAMYETNLAATVAYEEKLKTLREGSVADAVDAMGKIFGVGAEQQKWMKMGSDKQNRATRDIYTAGGYNELMRYEEMGTGRVRNNSDVLGKFAQYYGKGMGKYAKYPDRVSGYQIGQPSVTGKMPITGPDGLPINPDNPAMKGIIDPGVIDKAIKGANKTIGEATVILESKGGANNVQIGRLDVNTTVTVGFAGKAAQWFETVSQVAGISPAGATGGNGSK